MVKKSIYETDAVKAFVDGMSAVSQRKYRFARIRTVYAFKPVKSGDRCGQSFGVRAVQLYQIRVRHIFRTEHGFVVLRTHYHHTAEVRFKHARNAHFCGL